jgi:hypothetical protein
LLTEGSKLAEHLENYHMGISQVDLAQQLLWTKCSMLIVQSQNMIVDKFSIFLELDLIFQSYQRWSVTCNMIQIMVIIFVLTEIIISVMRSMAHISHL